MEKETLAAYEGIEAASEVVGNEAQQGEEDELKCGIGRQKRKGQKESIDTSTLSPDPQRDNIGDTGSFLPAQHGITAFLDGPALGGPDDLASRTQLS